MHETPRMLTGIPSLDPMLEMGLPPGSVILLSGEIGAGNHEFAYTSALSLAGRAAEEYSLLPEIWYVTFTKLSESVINEMEISFRQEMVEGRIDQIHFLDLSDTYFEASIVPTAWYTSGDILDRFRNRKTDSGDLLSELAREIGAAPPGSLIICDSLTDIATQYASAEEWNTFSGFLRGLQRFSKVRNYTIYLLLSEGILEEHRMTEIKDCSDAVLAFHWEENGARQRQRVMYIEKFRGLMPHLEEQNLVRFAVRISSESGFEVSNIRVVI